MRTRLSGLTSVVAKKPIVKDFFVLAMQQASRSLKTVLVFCWDEAMLPQIGFFP